jgi:hypothetical protein
MKRQNGSPVSKPSKRILEEKKEMISLEETRLYDRQIRLWGLKAQNRIAKSRVLVVGCTGLSNELLKNIVLAGIGNVTILDSTVVTPKDLGTQFLISETCIGLNVLIFDLESPVRFGKTAAIESSCENYHLYKHHG